jgi:hypothetical protein
MKPRTHANIHVSPRRIVADTPLIRIKDATLGYSIVGISIVVVLFIVNVFPHPYIASDANTTARLRNYTAQNGALSQSWKLLWMADMEWL